MKTRDWTLIAAVFAVAVLTTIIVSTVLLL
jgi:hypothetical protein